MPTPRVDRQEFLQRVVIVWFAAMAFVLSYVLVRQIVAALLTLFGALLFAVFLDACARWIQRALRLGRRVALTIVLLLMVGSFAVFVILAGPSIIAQTAQLVDQLPEAWQRTQEFVNRHAWSRDLFESSDDDGFSWRSGVVSRMTGIFSTAFGVWSSVAVAVVIAIFVAYSPEPYRRATLLLVPRSSRERAGELLTQIGKGLRWWLIGRVSSMAVVGVMTYIGLLVVDVPLALTLGLIAAVLSFVPYLGPILSVVPAMLVVVTDDPSQVLVVALLYMGIQVVEGNAITPFIQQRALQLPAALLIAVQFIMGALLGIGGVFMSTPLLVVVIIVVQMLYIETALGEDVERIGSR